jgi:parvulin-like peptidyl-prolyl isomerase
MFIKRAVSPDTWKKRLEMQLLIDKVIEKDLGEQISVSPQEIKAYHDRRYETPTEIPQVRVRQILLPTKEKATEIRLAIDKGEDFSDLARRHSTAPESSKGGDMGYIAQGDLPEEMEKAIFSMKEGEVSPVVSSSYGYHLFKVIQKMPDEDEGTQHWLDKARAEIKRQKLETAYRTWLDELRSKYRITVNDEMM